MSRISKAFAGRNAFIGYLTAGDAGKKEFLDLLRIGVDILEVGIPFSDPVADGPVIQEAMERALKNGMTPEKTLELVREIRKESEAPIILFTYFNPIQKQLESFLHKAKEAGADGILVVDLPIEEAGEYRKFSSEAGLEPIFMIAPSTPSSRIREIGQAGKGFLYYACRKGTTGARDDLPPDLEEKIGKIRAEADLPIAVGFGISTRKTANEILKVADGFVVGSYFVANMRS